MDLLQAVIIAIVEGLTEFLPVSSTGHMILTQGILGVKSDDFIKAFTVIIQFGAILSVLVLYWKRFFRSWDFYLKLLVAFLPAAVIGFLAGDYIDALLENVPVVAIMLILGGIFMLFVDKWFTYPEKDEPKMTNQSALKIGLAQCIAMIPGVSRSMATIVGGMSQKFSRKTAAEFSFFLAVPTMAAASGYKLLKLLLDDTSRELLMKNINLLIIGNIVAFVVAMAAIRFFIGFLTKYGFKAFGWYRILAGLVILILLAAGYHLEVA
ncbi:MAG: undecaprenyl-diphosphate phosphatase [Dysgonamonadaceae bacterium]|jgi:undecaprenyl-diphosphatase|nr:undecaprenyl-diphosphate phosphatase [Dysgonamonadaceae bacterium]